MNLPTNGSPEAIEVRSWSNRILAYRFKNIASGPTPLGMRQKEFRQEIRHEVYRRLTWPDAYHAKTDYPSGNEETI